MQVGVSRLGTYGDVTVGWQSIQLDDVSEQISVGNVRPPSGFVSLTNGQDVAVFTVTVIFLFSIEVTHRVYEDTTNESASVACSNIRL